MHAAPPVRVQIKPHPVAPVLVLGLLCVTAATLVLWFARLALGWPAAGVAIVVVLGACWQLRRSGRQDTVVHWDGQRWFAQSEGQNTDPTPGQLWLHLDFDGHSLLRFAPDQRQSGVKTPRWLVATPGTVRGPWQDWRAALIHAQRAEVLA